MKQSAKLLLLLLSLFLVQCASTSRFENFITTDKDKLMDGEKVFRFVSYNIPNLAYVEDYDAFTAQSPWRLPTPYEIKDALRTIRMDGGRVARIYTFSVRKAGESNEIVRAVEGPGEFNEAAFRTFDKVLQIANREGVRLIVPFVDNWWWWGGRAEYAAFRGKLPNDFWTDPQLISDFKKTIKFILDRKNTYTGVLYKDDKAILGWETGNELEAPLSWQDTIAAYIKSIDKNHLVLEGTFKQLLTKQEVADSNFDVLSTHYYTTLDKAVKDALLNRELTAGKKPYFIGEFGLRNPLNTKALVDTVINNGISGIMIWSLRGHARDGGFYQHSLSYRFPGFAADSMCHEKEIVNIMREAAYRINGEPEPPLPVPDPPRLLDIKDVYDISWQGSTGAASYKIQRLTEGSDNWETIADSATDAVPVFRPLYDDTTAELGKNYFYRVIAQNSSGASEPSNIVGPVTVDYRKLVDELADTSKILIASDSLKFASPFSAVKAKYDFSRLEGPKGAYVVYQVPQSIDSIMVEAFFTSGECGMNFFASDSLSTMKPIPAKLETFPPYSNHYGFYVPAMYTCGEFPAHSRYLKIEFNGGSELSRVEIIYSRIKEPNPDIVTLEQEQK
jgi:mannan endo-1,4-beta-mannosidase